MSDIKELKLKFRIKDFKKTISKLKEKATLISHEKATIYFFEESIPKVRADLHLIKKEESNEVELRFLEARDFFMQSKISTFRVNNAEEFVDFLESIGFKLAFIVHCDYHSYLYEDVFAELYDTKELGLFLELKVKNKNTDIEKEKNRLLNFAHELGIKDKQATPYFYIELSKNMR